MSGGQRGHRPLCMGAEVMMITFILVTSSKGFEFRYELLGVLLLFCCHERLIRDDVLLVGVQAIAVICILVWVINIRHFRDPVYGGWVSLSFSCPVPSSHIVSQDHDSI